MAICKYCDQPMEWGAKEMGGFVALVPRGEDEDLVKTYQDESGALRAEHRQVCIEERRKWGGTVGVRKLLRPVLPEPGAVFAKMNVDPDTGEITYTTEGEN